MTPAEAAAEIGITQRAVQDRLKRGLLRGTNYGGRVWLIDREEVERAKAVGPLKRGPKARKPKAGESATEERMRENVEHQDVLEESRRRIRGETD